MERHEILEAMSELKLYGMRASFDEIAGKGLARRDEIYPLIASLIRAERTHRQARSHTTATSSRPATKAGASRTEHNRPLATRRPPRPALLRYVGLRAAGLGSVKGVILGREKGVALGCDLTSTQRNHASWPLSTDFCNKIGTFRT